MLLLSVECLGYNLVPGRLGLAQLEPVEVVEAVPLALQHHPLGPVRAIPSLLNLRVVNI